MKSTYKLMESARRHRLQELKREEKELYAKLTLVRYSRMELEKELNYNQ